MRRARWCSTGWLVLTLAAAAMLHAQQPTGDAAPAAAQDGKPVMQTRPEAPQASSITVKANLVVLTAAVRDSKGALVQNLTKNDFTLQVGGKPQAIRYFDHETDVPLTLGLLVDASRSMQDYQEEERRASKSFLETMLLPASAAAAGKPARAADQAFVVQFAKQIELLQDVTDDRQKLESALRELGTESPSFHTTDTGDTTDSEGRMVRRGGTALYDAIYLSGNEVLAKQTGRKALVVLTDGVDVGSKESLIDALEAAQRADTIIYAVYFRGQQQKNNNGFPGQRRSGWPGGGGGGYPGGGYPGGGYPGGGYPGGGYPGGGYPQGGGNGQPSGQGGGQGGSRKPSVDGKQVLERLCGETGGRVFEVSKKQTIEDIYGQISEDLRSQYRLGFTPEDAAAKDGYHQIDLRLTGAWDKKKADIQTRDGYYVGTD